MAVEARERQILIYQTPERRLPYVEWFNALADPVAQQKIDARLATVRAGSLGKTRSLDDGVHELKIDYGPGYRVYFAFDGMSIVLLLCGGDKRSQARDIRGAKQYWAAYKKERNNAGS